LLATLSLLLIGCAHGSKTFMPPATPGDDRIVVAEFCDEWADPCRQFRQQILATAEVQQALGHVRFVEFDINTVKGSAAHEHFGHSQYSSDGAFAVRYSRFLQFLAMVDDRPVRRYVGSPFDAAAFIRFVDDVALLGGSEREIQNALAAAPDDPKTLVRAAAWYDARQRRSDGRLYWERLAARTDAPAELRAAAAWHAGAGARRGAPIDARLALRFADEHAGTRWALHALDVVAVSRNLPAPDVARALRANFELVRDDVDSVAMLTWTALGANLLDDALTIGERGVRMTNSASARELVALAQVHLARRERAPAVGLLQLAVEREPTSQLLATELDVARHGGGASHDRLERWRIGAAGWARLFFGLEP